MLLHMGIETSGLLEGKAEVMQSILGLKDKFNFATQLFVS